MLHADKKARLTRQPLRCWRRWGIGWTASCCCRWRALLPQLPRWWRSCRQPAPSVQRCQGIWTTAQTNILPLVWPLVSFPLWHLGFLPYLPSTFLPPRPPPLLLNLFHHSCSHCSPALPLYPCSDLTVPLILMWPRRPGSRTHPTVLPFYCPWSNSMSGHLLMTRLSGFMQELEKMTAFISPRSKWLCSCDHQRGGGGGGEG